MKRILGLLFQRFFQLLNDAAWKALFIWEELMCWSAFYASSVGLPAWFRRCGPTKES